MAATYVDAIWNGADFWRWNYGSPIGSPAGTTYGFMTEIPSYYYDEGGGTSISGFQPFTAEQRAAAQAVLASFAEIANITFGAVADGEGGAILFGMNAQSGSAGYAYYASTFGTVGGDVWIANTPPSTYATNLDVRPGTYGYLVLVHELGHAMGFKHTFQIGGEDGNQVVLDPAHDSYQYSVMSYTHQTNELFMRVVNPGTLAQDLEYFRVYPAGLQLYDIAALQYVYGANLATRAGNDVYAFDPQAPFFKCIWDGGGKDTISVANFSAGCRIDLGAGQFSDITILPDAFPPGWSGTLPTYDGKNNLSIAFGVTIENATGGTGKDVLIGNAAANALKGGGGADRLEGRSGGDRLDGGGGKDVLIGAGGADKFVFGSTLSSTAADTIKDFVHGSDEMQLDDRVFGAQVGAVGALAAEAFWGGAAAHDASDRVIYDSVTGNVYYDSDGTGPNAQVLFAVLTGSPDDIDFSDFRVI